MSKKISSTVRSEEKSASLLGGFARSDSPMPPQASGGDEDRNKPVPNATVPSSKHRKDGKKEIFENVFISEQQLESSLGTFCNMTIAPGTITLFQPNGAFMNDFAFASIDSYKTFERPLCMFILNEAKTTGGRNSIVQHRFRTSLYLEMYNAMKAHYNAWHTPQQAAASAKKPAASRILQQSGGSPFVVSADLIRDKSAESSSPAMKPEHRLLFGVEEPTQLVSTPEPPAIAASPKRKAVRTVNSKVAAAAAAAAAPVIVPTPPTEPTEEDIVRASLTEYISSAKQREALAALLGKHGRSVVLPTMAARQLSDPAWQTKLKTLFLFEALLQAPNPMVSSLLEGYRHVIKEQLPSPQLSLRERAQKVLSMLDEATLANSPAMFSGLAMSPTTSSLHAYPAPAATPPINSQAVPAPVSGSPQAPRKHVSRTMSASPAAAKPAAAVSEDPEKFLLANWAPIAKPPDAAASMFDLLYAGPTAAATPQTIAFDFTSSPSPSPSSATASPPQAPPPTESAPSSAFDFLN